MNLVERVKGSWLQPKSEWSAIEGEPGHAGYLIPNYARSSPQSPRSAHLSAQRFSG